MRAPIIKLERFIYNRETKTLCAEASGLPGFKDEIRVVGKHREVLFNCVETHRDTDNDVTHWEFKAVEVPFALVIFND